MMRTIDWTDGPAVLMSLADAEALTLAISRHDRLALQQFSNVLQTGIEVHREELNGSARLRSIRNFGIRLFEVTASLNEEDARRILDGGRKRPRKARRPSFEAP